MRPGDHLGPHSYTRRAMTDAMIGAHYPLQALIYSVALHRYLGQRLPGYSPRYISEEWAICSCAG